MAAPGENGSAPTTPTTPTSKMTRSLGVLDLRRISDTLDDNIDSFIKNSITREVNADTTSLICLLQSIGFQLKKFERVTSVGDSRKSLNNNELVHVTIECENSGMRADLEYRNPQCTCPKEEINASLWNISGAGKILAGSSTNLNNLLADEIFIESGSNLLPKLDKETILSLGDQLSQLIFLVNNFGKQVPQNGGQGAENAGQALQEPSVGFVSKLEASYPDSSYYSALSTSMTRCHTQPDIFPRDEISDRRFSLNQRLPKIETTYPSTDGFSPSLMRQSTFAMNDEYEKPRSSPPKIKSSPVSVCSTFERLSLTSDDGNGFGALGINGCLDKASFYLERARRMYRTKRIDDECSPIEFSNSLTDNVFIKPLPLSRNSSASSQRLSSPVTVRKKKLDSLSPKKSSSLVISQARRSLGPAGVSPATLTHINQNTTPKLPPRTRSIGTPSPTQRVAIEVAKKRADIASAESSLPSSKLLYKPASKIGIKSPRTFRANQSAFGSTSSVSSAGKSSESSTSQLSKYLNVISQDSKRKPSNLPLSDKSKGAIKKIVAKVDKKNREDKSKIRKIDF